MTFGIIAIIVVFTDMVLAILISRMEKPGTIEIARRALLGANLILLIGTLVYFYFVFGKA